MLLEIQETAFSKTTFSRQQLQNISIYDLFGSDVFPWDKLSRCCPGPINKMIEFMVNGLKRIIFLVYCITIVTAIGSLGVRISHTYTETYTKTNCSKYYAFNLANATHRVISVKSKEDYIPTAECDNSPIYFIGVIATQLLRISICLGMFYAIDSRYGVLKLWSENKVLNLRDLNCFKQLHLILGCFLLNIIISIIFTFIGIPAVLILAILGWIFNLKWIWIFLGKYLDDPGIVFLYLILTIQDVATFFEGCILTLVGFTQRHLEVDIYLIIDCSLHCTLLIYRVVHIIKNGPYLEMVLAILARIIPFLLSL